MPLRYRLLTIVVVACSLAVRIASSQETDEEARHRAAVKAALEKVGFEAELRMLARSLERGRDPFELHQTLQLTIANLFPDWRIDMVADELGLSKQQVKVVNELFSERCQSRSDSLEFAINELESKSRISDDDFSAAASKLRDQEQKCDQRLTEELLKTLTPEQAEKLALYAISFHTLEFAQMHFVSRVLKLTREQQELFDKASKTVRTCMHLRVMNKHPAGLDLSGELSVTKAIEEAWDSLDPVQLDICCRGTGRLKDRQRGESLKVYFQRQSPEEQKKLTKYYRGFRAIKEEIDKEAQLDRPNH